MAARAIKNRDRAVTFPDSRSQLYLKPSKLWWAGLQTQHSPPEPPCASLPLLEKDRARALCGSRDGSRVNLRPQAPSDPQSEAMKRRLSHAAHTEVCGGGGGGQEALRKHFFSQRGSRPLRMLQSFAREHTPGSENFWSYENPWKFSISSA